MLPIACNGARRVCGVFATDLEEFCGFMGSRIVSRGHCRLHTVLVSNILALNSYTPHTCASTQVLMDALPPSWEGKLLFVDHMGAFVSAIMFPSGICHSPSVILCDNPLRQAIGQLYPSSLSCVVRLARQYPASLAFVLGRITGTFFPTGGLDRFILMVPQTHGEGIGQTVGSVPFLRPVNYCTVKLFPVIFYLFS